MTLAFRRPRQEALVLRADFLESGRARWVTRGNVDAVHTSGCESAALNFLLLLGGALASRAVAASFLPPSCRN